MLMCNPPHFRRIPFWFVFILLAYLNNASLFAWTPPESLSNQRMWFTTFQSPALWRYDLNNNLEIPQLPAGAWGYGLGVDSKRRAWISDAIGNFIWQVNPSDLYAAASISLASTPYGVAIDPSDNIWVVTASSVARDVLLFNNQGQELARVALDPWQQRPLPLAAVHSDILGDVWVTDPEYGKVLKISSQSGGQILFSQQVRDHYPVSLAVDRDMNAWVGWIPNSGTSYSDYLLIIYDRFGARQKTIRIPIIRPAQLQFPLPSIAIDGLQQVWVANPFSNNSVNVFDRNGDAVRTLFMEAPPSAIAPDVNGNIWIVLGSIFYSNHPVIRIVRASDGTTINTLPFTSAFPNVRGDFSGFALANVVQAWADFDNDGYYNREEIDLGTDPFTYSSVPQWWLSGNVDTGQTGTGPSPVLYVNDNAGDKRHFVTLYNWELLRVYMNLPPGTSASARYVVYGYPLPSSLGGDEFNQLLESLRREQPLNLGIMGFPTPLNIGDAPPFVIANNIGRQNKLGVPLYPTTPAPSTVIELPNGLGRRGRFLLQGFIEDPRSCNPNNLSITNAIIVDVL